MKRILSIAAMAAVSAPIAAQAQDSTRQFEPSSSWVADFGDDYCRLARVFSDGKDEISLAFDRIVPGATLRTVIIGDGVRLYRRATMLGYRLLPHADERMAFLLRSDTPDGQQYLNLGTIFVAPPFDMSAFGEGPPPDVDAPPPAPPVYDRNAEQEYAGSVNGLALTEGTVNPISIDTGSMKAPIRALQACTDDLLSVWGLDVEKHKAMTRPVAPAEATGEWLPNGTIGFGDFGKLGGGMNTVRLIINAEGAVDSCAVHWPSLSESTNEKICNALKKNGKFNPALDGNGNPMATVWAIEPSFLFGPPPGT